MGAGISSALSFVGEPIVNAVVKPFFATCWEIITGNIIRSISYDNNDQELKEKIGTSYQQVPWENLATFDPVKQQKAILNEKTKCRNCDTGSRVRFIFQCGHMVCVGCTNFLEKCWNCEKEITSSQFLNYTLD